MANQFDKKKALFRISTAEEKQDFELLELAELNDNYEKVMRVIAELGESISGSAKTKEVATMMLALAEGIKKIKSDYSTQAKQSIEAFKEMQEEFLKGLGSLKDVMQEQDFNKNAGPLYKTMINSIAGVEKAINDKPLPAAWRWPQYASVGVRNRSFSNVDPSVDSMNIGEYDYVSMALSNGNATETYTFKQNGASGNAVATVVIVYTSSARTVISSVTKTPVVTT